MAALTEQEAILLQNVSRMMFTALNDSLAASDLLSRKLERQINNKDLVMPETDRPETMKPYLAMMRHSQFQLQRIAENMRELSGISLGRAELDLETLDLAQMCRNICKAVAELTEEIEVSFETDCRFCITQGDPRRLERLLLNLIANSLRQCHAGDRITIHIEKRGSTFYITVKDTGDGIRREEMPDLFQRFASEYELQEQIRGVGLGLSVAEGIAAMHGGNLVCTSTPGEGTTAVFSMPERWEQTILRSKSRLRYGNPMRPILVALSDVLTYEKFQPPYL